MTYGVDLESGVEEYLVAGVEMLGGMCEKFVTPGKKGPPDRLVTWPGGVIHFVETKRPKGGKLASWQERDHKRRTKLGCKVFCLWTKGAVRAYLNAMSVCLNKHVAFG